MQQSTNDHGLLQEIEEEMSRQKIEALWRRFGPYILGAAAGIVLVTALYSGWQSYKTSAQQKRTEALWALVESGPEKQAEKAEALAALAQQYKGTAPALFARFIEAGDLAKAGKKAQALAVYDALAADASQETFFRQMADILAVQTMMDEGDPAQLAARLEPLRQEDSAWRVLATEFAGHLAVRAGDKAKAKEMFEAVLAMPDPAAPVAQRSRAMLSWLNQGE